MRDRPLRSTSIWAQLNCFYPHNLLGFCPSLRKTERHGHLRADSHYSSSHHERLVFRSYRNYAGVLLRKAIELGWAPEAPVEMPEAWKKFPAAARHIGGLPGMVSHFIRMGKTPSDLTSQDLNGWEEMMLARKLNYDYAHGLLGYFRRGLVKTALTGVVPGIFRDWKPLKRYFVPLEKLPPTLGQELVAKLNWKQAPYAKGRPARSRIRAVSAEHLENVVTRLYGFLVNVLPELPGGAAGFNPASVQTLTELVTQELVNAYIEWWINVQQYKGRSLAVRLSTLYAALKEYPSYKGIDFAWFGELIRGVPAEPESVRRERREQKYLPYETLAEIPRRIHETQLEAATHGPRALAFALHDELLMKWLLVLPWRQRNIRECRIGKKSDGANLFKAEIEPWDTVKKPKWVEEKLKSSPREQFWQYRFRESETKTSHEVRSIVPRRLVPLLEEYLDHHRAHLLIGPDPGTLFMNRHGSPLVSKEVVSLVTNLTLRHAGKRVNPHLFRNIWAYWWLASHPEDYLTVSK